MAPQFWNSALDGGEWSASRPSHLTPGKRVLRPNWMGGWVGPRAGLDTVEKGKYCTARNRTWAVQKYV
jgi:hypothetical protein